ncbi:hypothetical protein [Gilliamella apicola]|uniref:hypothetical protein n=1 Tax=Gilliamella apicola TaxID=1196095 RepID=UPI00080E82BD|nr:hypothetical protein [Gilliamella apicola]OCG11989.1 hypothetical protein A9G14_05915 [Gilliamella apicola]ORF45414.1 hypothetical protein B5800_07895 [Gilliamella apicola]ORF47116.1 hypothetical protein B5803_12635 [Gilliamella apicola]ORF49270.1 hypothetical protein B5799_05370 [Gilliamella apicola]ORF53508.1 hypothetical protein B5798_09020 [Gilliamella apicola]
MNVKNIIYSIFILFLLNFTVKADVFNRQDVSTITIHNILGYDFQKSLILKITADSIFIPYGFCNDKECPVDGQDLEYLGHHDIFKFVPEEYLIRSNYINPMSYDGMGTTKLEICIVDGRCHSWNYGESDDKEMILFYDKLKQIRTGKSEYQFHPKTIPPLAKVIFDKKNLTSINLYQLINYPFTEVLLYTITADSITGYPSKICYLNIGKLQCEVKSKSIQYQDKYNIFKAFPTLFLSGSNFIDLREYGGGDNNFFALFKIEGCFNDGHCNIWDFYDVNRDIDDYVNRYHYDITNRYNDDETKEFLSKIMQLYYDTLKSNIEN